MATVFLSYTQDDESGRTQIELWHQSRALGSAVIGYEPNNIRPRDPSQAMPAPVTPQLDGARIVICVVGNETANYPWIDSELDHAYASGMTVIPTRAPNTSGPWPTPITNHGTPAVAFTSDALRLAIENA